VRSGQFTTRYLALSTWITGKSPPNHPRIIASAGCLWHSQHRIRTSSQGIGREEENVKRNLAASATAATVNSSMATAETLAAFRTRILARQHRGFRSLPQK
jgi:hypothetical protein